MASTNCNFYHEHGFDPRQFLEDYFSDQCGQAYEEDVLKFPIECLTEIFAKGSIQGDLLIELSVGPLVHLLYAACEFFKDIIVLKISDGCIMELKRWLDTRTGAFPWEHATKHHLKTAGKSDQIKDTEEKMRSALRNVMKLDLAKEIVMDSIPQADCVLTGWLLGAISKNQDDYIRNLRKISDFLKPGGCLIIIGALNTTHYTVGKDKIHYLKYDEAFVKNALVREGFVIDSCKVKKRTCESLLSNYEAVICISAHKEK